MKVLNREEFLKCPPYTIYAKGKEWYFDGLYIKADTLDNPGQMGDWVYAEISWPEGKDSGECFDKLDKSLETGSSFECNKIYGRDGSFDEDDLFLVYEKKDLEYLKSIVDIALDTKGT